jgi:hypothetical protein
VKSDFPLMSFVLGCFGLVNRLLAAAGQLVWSFARFIFALLEQLNKQDKGLIKENS